MDDLATLVWTTMPEELKRLARAPVRLFGLTLFHRRTPNAMALAFLMGHYWNPEAEQWEWDGRLKADTFSTLKGGHLPVAGRIAEMVKARVLS